MASRLQRPAPLLLVGVYDELPFSSCHSTYSSRGLPGKRNLQKSVADAPEPELLRSGAEHRPSRVDYTGKTGGVLERLWTTHDDVFATGAAAKAFELSLSSADEPVRRRSVEKCLEFIEFGRLFGAGVIVGFLKGGPGPDREQRRQRFQASLLEVAPRAL